MPACLIACLLARLSAPPLALHVSSQVLATGGFYAWIWFQDIDVEPDSMLLLAEKGEGLPRMV